MEAQPPIHPNPPQKAVLEISGKGNMNRAMLVSRNHCSLVSVTSVTRITF